MPSYIAVAISLVCLASGCATNRPSEVAGRTTGPRIDMQVRELSTSLLKHCTTLTTNGVTLTYGLVCPVFGDETVAVYEDVPPAGASTNDTMSIRIEDRARPLGIVADKGLDAVFTGPDEVKACRIADPLKLRERYLYVVGRLNELYGGHFRKRPGDRSPFEPPEGHDVTRDPHYAPRRQ